MIPEWKIEAVEMIPFLKNLGMFSAVAMPLFDIPLIVRIVQRKSSEDISLIWVVGIELCILGMLPSSLLSLDPILRVFGIVNTVLFTAVFLAVIYYHPAFQELTDRSTPRDPD